MVGEFMTTLTSPNCNRSMFTMVGYPIQHATKHSVSVSTQHGADTFGAAMPVEKGGCFCVELPHLCLRVLLDFAGYIANQVIGSGSMCNSATT